MATPLSIPAWRTPWTGCSPWGRKESDTPAMTEDAHTQVFRDAGRRARTPGSGTKGSLLLTAVTTAKVS